VATGASIKQVTAFEPRPMHWLQTQSSLPLPDFELIAAQQPELTDSAELDQWWTAVAGHWLLQMGEQLSASGPACRIHESSDFLLLSALDERAAHTFLSFCQSVRRWILRNLGEIGAPRAAGKHVALVFAEDEDYYRYISHYYPEQGEFALSAGVFVPHGYGHFALTEGEMEHMQPTIAHELTHCLLSHLPIPAWLNEGLATNMEAALFPHLNGAASSIYRPHELAAKHAAFWNAETIQEFWSGKSFLRTDDGNLLSYDLARRITGRAALDEAAFSNFVRTANQNDGGIAAQQHLGYPVEHLVIAMLGEGPWTPQPQRWISGIESGQFQNAGTQPPP
jgi:hypothetical protein